MQKFLNMNWVFCLPSAVPTKNREKKEDRLAREQALDGHWPITEGKKSWATYPPVGEDRIKLHCKISRLQAAFSPVPDPSNYLSPLLPVSQWKKTVMACFYPQHISTEAANQVSDVASHQTAGRSHWSQDGSNLFKVVSNSTRWNQDIADDTIQFKWC